MATIIASSFPVWIENQTYHILTQNICAKGGLFFENVFLINTYLKRFEMSWICLEENMKIFIIWKSHLEKALQLSDFSKQATNISLQLLKPTDIWFIFARCKTVVSKFRNQ